MKKSRFTESQMMAILEKGGSGITGAEVCSKHGICAPTYYQWKSKYVGMSLPELKRVKELEAESAKLKRMFAEQAYRGRRYTENEQTRPRGIPLLLKP